MTFFTHTKFINFVYQVFGRYKQTKGNLEVVCPICKKLKGEFYDKRKFSINLDKKPGMCKCWVCGYISQNLIHILSNYHPEYLSVYKDNFYLGETLQGETDVTESNSTIVEVPEGFSLLATSDRNDLYIKTAIQYLKDRKIDIESDLWYWKLGVSTHEKTLLNRIIVPSFNTDGDLNFYSARTWDKKQKKKYQNPNTPRENIIFNEINLNFKEEITIVEGVFDLMKCNTNSTCLLGSEITANFKLFQEITTNKTPVVLALDNDAMKKTMKIAERLFEFDVPVKILEIPDDFEDVGVMTKNEFIDIIKDASVFDADYSLKRKILEII